MPLHPGHERLLRGDPIVRLSFRLFTDSEIEDLDPFTVAVPKDTTHPENVFKDSVDHREDVDHHLYVMKDQVAVEEAECSGGIRGSTLDRPVVF